MTNERPLAGQIALVTGASRTLGADIARALARNGVNVAVNYVQAAGAAGALCEELRDLGVASVPIQADVGVPEDADRLVETAWDSLGPIDILVNNTGPYVDTPFLQLPVEDFDRVMAANVRGTYLVTKSAGPRMKAAGGGNVVNIGATSASLRSGSVYGLAKAGVEHLTQALALELAPEVRVNVVTPGLIADNEGADPVNTRNTIDATPMGRLVTRAEIAEAVCMLCGPPFEAVTGQTIVMDGGRSIPRAGYSDLGHA